MRSNDRPTATRASSGSVPAPPHWSSGSTASTPTRPAWTFVPAGPNAGTAGFWTRRQAHELTVHRYDAQLAAGTTAPVDADLAADGIDELLVVMLPFAASDRLTGAGETIHVHCTDRPGEWVVRLAAGGPEVERGAREGRHCGAGRRLRPVPAAPQPNRSGTCRALRRAPTVLDRFRTAATL